jgi:poly-gamma-glutamate capsule biosynthesis protein CapA/YwtB (metallophosphatase superfamily)
MFITLILTLRVFNIDTNAQINIKAVGDIMLGSVTPKEILPPDNGNEFVQSAAHLLDGADIVFGNLEGSFITDEMEPEKCKEASRKRATCYEFGMPDYLAVSLKELGFNVMNQDNNHSEDYGDEGYLFTQDKLEKLDIKFMPKKGLAEFNINNVRVALTAFGYSENSYHISDLDSAKIVINSLIDKYDIIIVSFHGGAEGRDALNIKDSIETYLGENRGNVIAFAHAVVDAGADMVIGHGPHVLRAMEVYKNKLIAYSLGNFLTYGNMNVSGINAVNVILQAELENSTGDFTRGKLISMQQVGNGIPSLDEKNEGFHLIKSLTTEDIPKPNLLFVGSDRIYNSEIFTPPIRPMMSWRDRKNNQVKFNSGIECSILEGVKTKRPGLKLK